MEDNDTKASKGDAPTDIDEKTLGRRKAIEKRSEEIIALVQRQTDYDREMTISKLQEWEGNYISVIREFMNPDHKDKEDREDGRSLNQRVLGEMRGFIDQVNEGHIRRKEAGMRRQMRMMAVAQARLARKKAKDGDEEED